MAYSGIDCEMVEVGSALELLGKMADENDYAASKMASNLRYAGIDEPEHVGEYAYMAGFSDGLREAGKAVTGLGERGYYWRLDASRRGYRG